MKLLAALALSIFAAHAVAQAPAPKADGISKARKSQGVIGEEGLKSQKPDGPRKDRQVKGKKKVGISKDRKTQGVIGEEGMKARQGTK